jgi:two-component sensor histidine kinase
LDVQATKPLLPDDAAKFNQGLSRALTEKREWRARTEFFQKDGRSGFGEVLFVPIEDEGRPSLLLGIHKEINRDTIDDIAGERIQHRIRNQLQMVGSLFGLESDEPAMSGTEEALMLQKLQARLRSVTRLQETRVRGAESRTVRLAAYARILADDLMRICAGIHPESEVIGVFGDESIVVDTEAAGPFGLLVTELGLAVFRATAKKTPIHEGGLTIVIQPNQNGMTRFAVDMAAEIYPELSRPILECLVSQLRGRLEVTRRDGHSRLMVGFPKIAD